MGREVGGASGCGDTCAPVTDPCRCVTGPPQCCEKIDLQEKEIILIRKAHIQAHTHREMKTPCIFDGSQLDVQGYLQ